jgi:putative Mn2+ efflux pump MntP
MGTWQYHLDALVLAVASSTDNFMVGLSMGIGKTRYCSPLYTNVVISVCNALGAYVASHGGIMVVKHSLPAKQQYALYLSSFAFGILAVVEYKGYRDERNLEKIDKDDSGKDSGPHHSLRQGLSSVWTLAFPMTLNNLAGGVAGGAAGLNPPLSAMYALVVSFATMWMGYWVGRMVNRRATGGSCGNMSRKSRGGPLLSHGHEWMDPSVLSALLLGTLCLMTLREAAFGWARTI